MGLWGRPSWWMEVRGWSAARKAGGRTSGNRPAGALEGVGMLTAKPRLPIRAMLGHGWLPSFLKTRWYRWKGYRIGRGVRLGFGSVILGREVMVGDHCELGFFSFIRGDRIHLGRHVQIGSVTMLDTPHLEIGDGTKINEQVFVGGLQFPDSKLVVGRNCQIMQMTFINPARSVVIGDDTGIGGDCLLFGHTSWLSELEGYPVEFEPIEIGRSVSLAWRVFVLPGTQIGDGAVVGANSLVRGKIPGRCLAVGFPARVVSREPEFPRVLSDAEKQARVEAMILELMGMLEAQGFPTQRHEMSWSVAQSVGWGPWRRSRRWGLRLNLATPLAGSEGVQASDVLLSLAPLSTETRVVLTGRGVLWLDLSTKERADVTHPWGEEVVQHLRRHGLRFYRHGGRAD